MIYHLGTAQFVWNGQRTVIFFFFWFTYSKWFHSDVKWSEGIIMESVLQKSHTWVECQWVWFITTLLAYSKGQIMVSKTKSPETINLNSGLWVIIVQPEIGKRTRMIQVWRLRLLLAISWTFSTFAIDIQSSEHQTSEFEFWPQKSQ